MNPRRIAIIRILTTLSTLILYSKKSTASMCTVTNPDIVDIYIPKNILINFYFGKIEDYFNREYTDYWIWSNDIKISGGSRNRHSVVEMRHIVPIKISHNMSFDNEKLYCSNMDILYVDDDHTEHHPMHLLSAIHFSQKAIPTFSIKIKMTSNKAKIYAVLTFRNIIDNEIHHIEISNSPTKIQFGSCNPKYNFWYRDT